MANRLCWSTVALLALAGVLRADIPPAPPTPDKPEGLPPLPARFARPQSNYVRFVFRFDNPDGPSCLRLPSTLLKDVPEVGQGTSPTGTPWLAPPRNSLIAAGLAMTLLTIASGLWLTRWRVRRLLGGGILLVAVVLLNVSGCPWNYDPRLEVSPDAVGPLIPSQNGNLFGNALLERDDGLDAIQLFINRDELMKFADRAANAK